MRKIVLCLIFALFLAGCSAEETFETLGPVLHGTDQLPAMAKAALSLPDSAVAQTFGNGADVFYECDGYSLVLQTLSSGDFRQTLSTLSGFSPEHLTVMESREGLVTRYDWVWTATAEEDLICRASVLDDGNYHYCLYVMAPARSGSDLAKEWNTLFASFHLS